MRFSNIHADIEAETDFRHLRDMLRRRPDARHTILRRWAHLCSERDCGACAECGKDKKEVLAHL